MTWYEGSIEELEKIVKTTKLLLLLSTLNFLLTGITYVAISWMNDFFVQGVLSRICIVALLIIITNIVLCSQILGDLRILILSKRKEETKC